MANRSNRSTDRRSGLEFESLEARQLLAFDFLFDGTTLTLTQVADDGVVTIDNAAPGDAFRVADGAGLVTYEAATNLEVHLLDNTNHLSFALENPHAGDVSIHAGDGNRSILFVGTHNEVGGDLSISAGDGDQFISPAHIQDLVVGGSLQVDTGDGLDELRFANHVQTGNHLATVDALTVDFQTSLDVGGDLNVVQTYQTGFGSLEKTSATPSTVGGNLIYEGNSRADLVDLANVTIAGDLIAHLDDGFVLGPQDQLLALDQVEMTNFMLTSGDTTNVDAIIWSSVVVNGNIDIDAGGGTNQTSLHGTNNGGQVRYVGQDGVDHFQWTMSGAGSQDLDIMLGADIDTFELFDGSSIGNLGIDFGGVENHFLNHWGAFAFDAQLNRMDFFNVDYQFASDTMSLTEIDNVLVGDLDVFTDNLTNDVRISTGDLTPVENLNIQLLDGSVRNLTLHMDHELTGSLNIDLGSGDKSVEMDGTVNFIHGDVAFTGASGEQTVYLAQAWHFHAGGDVLFDLGEGLDLVLLGTKVFDVDGSVDANNVNYWFSEGVVAINGDLGLDVTGETEGFALFDDGAFVVAGNMTFAGNAAATSIQFQSPLGSAIGGNFTANLGESSLAAQGIYFGPTSQVGGDLLVTSINSMSEDIFIADAGAEILGDMTIDYGDGLNSIILEHTAIGGNVVRYEGGSGTDYVALNAIGDANRYNLILGEGDDGFTLLNASTIGEFLRVDFGGGAGDDFANLTGNWTYDTRILNFHGFNHFYEPATSYYNLVQVADLGDVQMTRNAGGTFSFDSNGYTGTMTEADHLQVQMQPNSSGNVEVALDSQLNGDLTLNLRHGDREARLNGIDNSINGDLRIVAGDGVQHVYLAEHNDLSVKGDTVINLRDGSDTIIDSGNQISVGNNLVLRNVDTYEVKNRLDVFGNMSMVSHWYVQDTLFDNDGIIDIAGRLTYLGSEGSDDLNLTGNVTIGDDVYIQLGENTTTGLGQVVDLGGGFQSNARLAIQGSTSLGGNHLISDEFTRVGGDLIVDFAGSTSTNTAVLKGQYGGNYGTFRGGSAADVLEFDAIAGDMEWATLMFGEDDEVHLGTATDLAFKYIDFGFGSDLFEDDHIESFPMNLVNLP